MQSRIMYLTHNITHAVHPGSSRIYSILRCPYYRTNMPGDIQDCVASCQSCLRTRSTQYRESLEFKLLPATDPLTFVVLNLLGPLPKSKSVHANIPVIPDLFTKFTRTITLKSTTSQALTDNFLMFWDHAYGPP